MARNLSLPAWASWNWDQKYLPPDIHTRSGEFNAAVNLLHKYTYVDRDEGTPVVLGFGLLLRECGRAVEAEDGDEETPQFLKESLLDMERAAEVIKVIKKLIGKSSLSDTDEEVPKKKSRSSGKGKKAKAGQEKEKDDRSPVRNIRSQRQRKPSKKLRDSD